MVSSDFRSNRKLFGTCMWMRMKMVRYVPEWFGPVLIDSDWWYVQRLLAVPLGTELFPCGQFFNFYPPHTKDAVCWSARCWHMLACADQHRQHVHRFWPCWSDISNAHLISRLYVTYVTYVTHFTNPPPKLRERINREVVVVLLMPSPFHINAGICWSACQRQRHSETMLTTASLPPRERGL